MYNAVRFGRVEMIEVLEQDGQSFDGCIEAALDKYQTPILQWLLETNKYDNLTDILDVHLHWDLECVNEEGIGIILSHMYSIEPGQESDVKNLIDRWCRENSQHISDEVLVKFAPADVVRSRIAAMDPYYIDFLFCRRPFDADLVNSVRSSFEERDITLYADASSDATRYCLEHFDQSRLRLDVNAETISEMSDCIDFDSFDWRKSKMSKENIIAFQNAGVSLAQINKHDDTIHHSLLQTSYLCPRTVYEAIAYLLSQGVDPNVISQDWFTCE